MGRNGAMHTIRHRAYVQGRFTMSVLRQLWVDEAGFIISTELVLVATILVLSMVVGMKKISSQVLAEMSDVGNAIGFLNQGYSFAGATFTSGDGCLQASWSGTG